MSSGQYLQGEGNNKNLLPVLHSICHSQHCQTSLTYLGTVRKHYLLTVIPTFPDVPLVVPGLHPDPAAEAERLEGGEAGLGAEVVMADQDTDLGRGRTY